MSFQSKESHSIAADNNKITIWDLPSSIKRMQVFETVWFLGRVELIEIIRSSSGKTKTVVSFRENSCEERKLKEIWYLLFMDQIFVRIIPGVNDHKILYTKS